jgi:hypothetical protein
MAHLRPRADRPGRSAAASGRWTTTSHDFHKTDVINPAGAYTFVDESGNVFTRTSSNTEVWQREGDVSA